MEFESVEQRAAERRGDRALALLLLLALVCAVSLLSALASSWTGNPRVGAALEQTYRPLTEERPSDTPGHIPLGARRALGLATDPNAVTAADLATIKGIGPGLAAKLVESRELYGPFKSIDDMGRVEGVGPTKLERLREALTLPAPK